MGNKMILRAKQGFAKLKARYGRFKTIGGKSIFSENRECC